jgi:hypothetical protein
MSTSLKGEFAPVGAVCSQGRVMEKKAMLTMSEIAVELTLP